jgi:hypothetical protein
MYLGYIYTHACLCLRRQQLKQIHIKLSELLHRELRVQAAIKGQTLQDYVVEAIEKRIALDKSNANLTRMIEESPGDNDTR